VTDELLQTKLTIPPPRPALVARPRLLEKLDRAQFQSGAPGAHLSLVSAPAGSGKSTLLAAWLHQRGPAMAAWLALDGADNDFARFCAYFFGALAQLGVLDADSPVPVDLATARAALTPPLNRLQADGRPAALILDDAHLLTSAEIWSFLTFFLELSPPNLHLLLATRADPPLPLPRLRVQGRITELRAAHLRFSAAESARFFADVLGLELSVDALRTLVNRTRGWAAGLQLAGLALQGRSDQSGGALTIDGGQEAVAAYLLTEVFHQQSAVDQTFLLATAVPDRLCAPLCRALLPANLAPRAGELLAQTAAANLFLTPLDDRRTWYRYHPLFRQFLLARLAQTAPAEHARLQQAAGKWWAAQGQAAAAVPHFLAAGDHAAAAAQMAQAVDGLMRQGELTTVGDWLKQLPAADIWTNPALARGMLWLFIGTGRPDALTAAMADETAAAALPANPELLTLQAVAAAMRDQPAQAREYARRAEAAAADEEPRHAAYVTFALAGAYKTSREFAAAETAFLRAAALAEAADLPNIRFSAVANLGDMQFETGRLAAAAHTCRQALTLPWPDRAGQSAPHPFTGWIHWSLGRIAYARNELEDAARHAAQSVPLCEEWGHLGMAARAQMLQADLARTRREWGAAQSLLDVAESLATRSGDGRLEAAVIYRRQRLALAQEDLPAARHWAGWLQAVQGTTVLVRLAAARLALADRQPQRALPPLQTAREQLQELGFVPLLLQTWLLIAAAQAQQGGPAAAQEAWREAVALGEAGGFLRPFLDEGVPVLTLLQADKTPSPYQARLLAAFDPLGAQLPVQLTPREQEILQLIAAGFSNQAIAAQLVIAPATAKRHVSNLYRKLDVHRRTSAISRARELGLL